MGYDRRLNTIAEINAAIPARVQNLLDRHGIIVVDIFGNGLKLGQEFFIVKRDLGVISFALAQRIGIGTLVGDHAAAGFSNDLHTRQFSRRDRAIGIVEIGDTTGAVFHPIS